MSHWLRIMIWILATQFLWVAGYFFLDPRAARFENPEFLGGMALVSAVVLIIPEIFFLIPFVRRRFNGHLRTWFGVLIALPVLLSWLGTFYWYTAGWGYDSVVHFSASFFGSLLAFGILLVMRGPGLFRKRAARPILFFLIAGLSLFGGIVNEVFEKYGDVWFHTQMFGEAGEEGDTIRDIAYDLLGAVLGSFACLARGEKAGSYFSVTRNP
ncbi:MAG: hypothetical protein Q8P82_00620, partial [bacterium]|nr:hypothetical protein [bacterium]